MPELAPILAVDVPALAAFLANFQGESQSADSWAARLRSWWDLNPAFQSTSSRGWLLRDEGVIVGMLGNIPLEFLHDGQPTIVFATTTWRVLSPYRRGGGGSGHSTMLRQRYMEEHRSALHFSATPAPQVVAVLERLGYRRLSEWQGTHAQSIIVLNFNRLLDAKFRSIPFRRLWVPLLAPLLAGWQRWRLRPVRKPHFAQVIEATQADGSFDELWTRTREVYAHTNIRAAANVQWYCFSVQPERKKLFACRLDGKLIGYLILLIESEGTATIARCVDYWADVAHANDTLQALVAGVSTWAAVKGFDRLNFPHFTRALGRQYKRLGLFERSAEECRAYVAGPPEMLTRMSPEKSYFVGAQGDVGL